MEQRKVSLMVANLVPKMELHLVRNSDQVRELEKALLLDAKMEPEKVLHLV